MQSICHGRPEFEQLNSNLRVFPCGHCFWSPFQSLCSCGTSLSTFPWVLNSTRSSLSGGKFSETLWAIQKQSRQRCCEVCLLQVWILCDSDECFTKRGLTSVDQLEGLASQAMLVLPHQCPAMFDRHLLIVHRNLDRVHPISQDVVNEFLKVLHLEV